MKKAIRIALIFLLLAVLCSGCSRALQPLRICVDLAFVSDLYIATELEDVVYDLESSIKNAEGIEDCVIECVPRSGAEREAALDRIRTELMSGGGPDVFITHCTGNDPDAPLGNPLFLMPEKSMEIGLFLPLDEYIENAKYAEWDKFTQAVMDAGRNEEGQQLIPLTYYVHTAIYRAGDFSHTPSNMTWNEMLLDETLYDTAARLGDGESITRTNDAQLDCILGKLADFKKEELAFTEEEMYQRITEICALTAYTNETKPYYTDGWTEGSPGYIFNRSSFGYRSEHCLNGIRDTDALTLVPLYSDDGGCTAIVLSFAAVNRNTQRPEEAFAVIDLLLSTGRQKHSRLYLDYVYRAFSNNSMPMHEEIMSVQSPTSPLVDLSASNFMAVSAVRDEITNVQFAGSLNSVLDKAVKDSFKAYKRGDDYSDIVHEAYEKMNRMLGE